MSTVVQIERSGKRAVVSRIVDGKLVDRDKIDPDSRKSRATIAKALGVDDSLVLGWLQAPGEYQVPETAVEPGAVIVRALEQAREHGVQVPDVETALRNATPVSQVIDWEKIEDCCCLDVDYHDVPPPPKADLETWVLSRVSPKPKAWHFSRSGGLHLFYVKTDVLTGEELAAVAALRWRMIDSSAKVELKRVARGPGNEKVHFAIDQDVSGANSSWLSERTYDESAVQEWCDDHGFVMGKRHSASMCPICPTADPGDALYNKPVMVSEAGIFCFHCQGNGRSLGCRTPGFAPWAAILDHPSTGDVGLMVRNLTHWGHAKYVFTERYGLPEQLARIAYRAACKSYHGNDPRIEKVFNPHTDTLIRVDDSWRELDGYTFPKDIQPLLAQLPQATSPAAVCILQQGCDLTRYGFPPVEIIHGFRQASIHLPPSFKTQICRPCSELVKRGNRFLPRYVPRNKSGVKRQSEEWAWDQIYTVLPGLDRKFVKLALCAIGSAQETRLGMLPLVFVSGPSGAGKTSTVRAAGGILGATISDVLFQSDEVRYYASITTGKQTGAALCFNEILKDANRSRGFDTRTALSFFLSLSEHAQSHVLHVGPRKLGKLPACFMSEPACPPELRDDVQLARRIRDVRVDGEKVLWEKTLPAAGLTIENLYLLRTVSPEVNEACNVILSETVDEFFGYPAMSFDAQCERLGVWKISQSPEFEDPVPFFRDFFRLVCEEKPITNPKVAKRYSAGFKQISKTDDDSDLNSVYTKFADGANPPEWCASRTLTSRDWTSLLGAKTHVHLDLLTDKVSVFVRFRTGPYDKPTAVNGEITNGS